MTHVVNTGLVDLAHRSFWKFLLLHWPFILWWHKPAIPRYEPVQSGSRHLSN